MKYKMWKFSFLAFALFSLCCSIGCQRNAQSNWVETDMMEYGLPIKIKGPENLDVNKSKFMQGQEVFSIRGEDHYNIEVWSSDAQSSDVGVVKSELLDIVQRNKYFKKIVHDYPEGFIYYNEIDSLNSWYGLRKVKIQGTKQFIFQNPPSAQYDLEMSEYMYAAMP